MPCRGWTAGNCTYGDRCRFSNDQKKGCGQDKVCTICATNHAGQPCGFIANVEAMAKRQRALERRVDASRKSRRRNEDDDGHRRRDDSESLPLKGVKRKLPVTNGSRPVCRTDHPSIRLGVKQVNRRRSNKTSNPLIEVASRSGAQSNISAVATHRKSVLATVDAVASYLTKPLIKKGKFTAIDDSGANVHTVRDRHRFATYAKTNGAAKDASGKSHPIEGGWNGKAGGNHTKRWGQNSYLEKREACTNVASQCN